uniref:CARD domain-containing protein n=1 Tax=Salmo trutta TaxID=8032 RepID=A0A673WCC1_SALTR
MAVPELLLATLDDLGKEELKEFKWRLRQGVEGFPQRIPMSQLEYAGREDTISKMVETYQPENAVKITLEILRKMNQNKLAETLNDKCKHHGACLRSCEGSGTSIPSGSGQSLHPKNAAEFVDRHRAELIQRVRKVMPIADDLLRRGMINYEMFANITTSKTNQGKMRELYKALQSGGTPLKTAFYRILLKNERLLVINLGKGEISSWRSGSGLTLP